MTTTTNAKEFKRAPTNLSHKESELVSLYAMVAILLIEAVDELKLRIETKITTRNMHIDTGATILTISSPRVSIMLEDLWFCAIDEIEKF